MRGPDCLPPRGARELLVVAASSLLINEAPGGWGGVPRGQAPDSLLDTG